MLLKANCTAAQRRRPGIHRSPQAQINPHLMSYKFKNAIIKIVQFSRHVGMGGHLRGDAYKTPKTLLTNSPGVRGGTLWHAVIGK